MKYTNYYLIKIQYLGFRYHGWYKQPDVKTVQMKVEKTLGFVLGHKKFKTLGSSRTDAMVSANQSAFELFINQELDQEEFMKEFNSNLPPDIRGLSIESVTSDFNIIQSPKVKEYMYLFASGEKAHPFSAPLVTSFEEPLDVELMKQGAQLFVGEKNFRVYCTKPTPNTKFVRSILTCKIEENNAYQANFFPEKSYLLRISAAGFMRNQVRLIMGQLIRLGKGEICLDDIRASFQDPGEDVRLNYIAPASGLVLNRVDFDL